MTKPNHNAARTARRAQAAELANENARRKRIRRLLEVIGGESTNKDFLSGIYHCLRFLVPADDAIAAFTAIVGGPTEEDIKTDSLPLGYEGIDAVDSDVYAIYAACFAILFDLEGLSGAVSPRDIINSYKITRK